MYKTFESFNKSKIINPIDRDQLKSEQEIKDNFKRKRDTTGHNWTFNDFVLVVYNYKYGFKKLQLTEQQVANTFIGTTEASFIMQLANIRKIYGETDNVLSDYTPTQLDIAKFCDSLTENELQDKVENILDSISPDQQEKNEIIVKLREKKLEEDKQKKVRVKDTELSKKHIKQLNKQNKKLVTSRKVSLSDLSETEKEQFKNDMKSFKENGGIVNKNSINDIINNIIKN